MGQLSTAQVGISSVPSLHSGWKLFPACLENELLLGHDSKSGEEGTSVLQWLIKNLILFKKRERCICSIEKKTVKIDVLLKKLNCLCPLAVGKLHECAQLTIVPEKNCNKDQRKCNSLVPMQPDWTPAQCKNTGNDHLTLMRLSSLPFFICTY